MQNKPGDTPKIILLAVLIIVVFGIVGWQLLYRGGAKSNQNTATSGSNAPTQIASADTTSQAGPVSGAGPGQTRLFDDELDRDPPPGQIPSEAGTPVANAFYTIKPPPANQGMTRGSRVTVLPGGNKGPRTARNGGFGTPPFMGDWRPPTQGNGANGAGSASPGPAPVPSIQIAKDIRLEGVMGEPEMTAMLSLREGNGRDALEQTVFKRVGDKIENMVITSIREDGITLRGHRGLWQVGQTLRFGITIPTGPTNRPGVPATPTTTVSPLEGPAPSVSRGIQP